MIPDIVIEELDDKKKEPGDKGYNARRALRMIESFRQKGSLVKGVRTDGGGEIRIASEVGNTALPDGWKDKPDNRILRIAKHLADTVERPVILISRDMGVRIKGDVIGVRVEDYRHEMIEEDYLAYTGRGEAWIASSAFNIFMASGIVPVENLTDREGKRFQPKENQFLLLHDSASASTALGMYREGSICRLVFQNSRPFGITPRNAGQRFCIEALLSESVPLVILYGPAGSAKTFLTLACGLQQTMEEGIYKSKRRKAHGFNHGMRAPFSKI